MFDDTDAAFPPTNQCSSIRPSIVGSPSIFGRIGVGRYVRNPLALIFAPAMNSHAIVGIDGRFSPWENFSNLSKI